MKIFHICNDFFGSKVHENLYKNLANLNVEQTIFYPTRTSKIHKLEKYEENFEHTLVTSKPLKNYHRILFRNKIRFLYKSLETTLHKSKFDIVHATTLFSDGAIALKIKKKFKIPFVTAVRSTDIDAFLKYRPDLILLGLEILNESAQIIFISKALRERFLNHPLIIKHKQKLNSKCIVINNGIDSFWLNNKSEYTNKEPNKILYVGSMVKRKNVIKLIYAVLNLNKKVNNIN